MKQIKGFEMKKNIISQLEKIKKDLKLICGDDYSIKIFSNSLQILNGRVWDLSFCGDICIKDNRVLAFSIFRAEYNEWKFGIHYIKGFLNYATFEVKNKNFDKAYKIFIKRAEKFIKHLTQYRKFKAENGFKNN